MNESNRRKQTGSKKTDYKISDSFQVSVINAEHNHARSAESAAHSVDWLAATLAETVTRTDSFAKARLTNAQIVSSLRSEDIGVTLTSKDVSNIVQKAGAKELKV